MRENKNFAKLSAGNVPEWGPVPLVVVIHHHEEWDEETVDPDTGEESTEHKSRDWDTLERKVRPTAGDYLSMGYLPVVYNPPSEQPPDGYHWEESSYVPSQDGASIVCEYMPARNKTLSGLVFPSSMTLKEIAGAVERCWCCMGGSPAESESTVGNE